MPRAFFARLVAVAALCVLFFSCSRPDQVGSAPEARVSSTSEALGAAGAAGASGTTCTVDADCGNGCGVCNTGTCGIAPATVQCRAAAGGGCDVPEMCDGVSNDCPVNVFSDNTLVCYAGNGTVCDPAVNCTGFSATCPGPNFAPTSTICRPSLGVCDPVEKCDGVGTCPADVVALNTVVCAGSGTLCDPTVKCTGSSATCPGPTFAPASTICHPSLGVCDPAEKCDGAGTCPADAKLGPAAGTCRPTVLGGCDIPDVCDGVNNDCPADAIANGAVVCAGSGTICDPAVKCTGASAACPGPAFASTATLCRAAAGVCDTPENCDGAGNCPADAKLGPATVPSPCGPLKGPCDIQEVCSGSSNDCPTVDAKQPASHICHDIKAGSLCDVAEHCSGTTDACPADAFQPATFTCRPEVAGNCDIAENCTGTSPDCPPDLFQPATHACNPAPSDPTSCDVSEFCSGADAVCPPDAVAPKTTVCRPLIPQQPCDQVETCDGVSKACPPNAFKPKGSSCDDGLGCTQTDTCDDVGHCAGTPNNSLCGSHACSFDFCSPTLGCQHTLNATTDICRPAQDPLCDVAEHCDGVNVDCPADVVKPASTECQPLSCLDGTLKPAIQCTGTSNTCPTVASSTCGNFACGSATECRTTCVTSDDCGPAFYCSNNDCIPRIGAGQSCKTDSECPISNNHCVDGVCCDTTCTGQCEACNTTGKVGTCVGVKGDPIGPRSKCAADGTKCDGFCDPSNRTACQFPNKATSCRDPSCDSASNGAVAESFCTGKGSCALTKTVACDPYACSGTACAGNCTADAQCAKDAYCQAGKCTPKGKPADMCTTDKQCGSGHCADGVCCDTACTGQCEACNNVPGADAGTCSPVTGTPLGKKTACAANDAACAGTCDGKNRLTCNYPAQGVVCRDGACTDGKATVTGYCDGHGACPATQIVSCDKGCEGTVCSGDECALDSDCKDPGKYCAAGACTPKAAPGAACSAASGCKSGFCTDGVCCDSACLGQCEACDASGSMGTCSAVPKGDSPHGGRTSCATDGSVCGGTCDGSTRDACKYPFDLTCRAGSCVAGVTADDQATSILEATCIGNGSCPAEQEQLCAQDGCDPKNTLCNGACSVDKNACKNGEYCSAGECIAKLGPAAACANDAQCGSGFCVDGVCCDKRCGDQCAACDVPGSEGTCTPVSGAAHGGRAACGGVGTCGAACDGSAVSSCSFADKTVSCGEAFCSAGVKGPAPVCDGDGTCAPSKTTACSSFACDGAECSNACTKDSDCVKQFECRKGVCLAPILIDADDQGTCGCSAPGSRAPASASLFIVLGLCSAVAFRRRRRAA